MTITTRGQSDSDELSDERARWAATPPVPPARAWGPTPQRGSLPQLLAAIAAVGCVVAILCHPAAASALGVAGSAHTWQLASAGIVITWAALTHRLDRSGGPEDASLRASQAAALAAGVAAVIGLMLAPAVARASIAVLLAAWLPVVVGRALAPRHAAGRPASAPLDRLVLVGPADAVANLTRELGRSGDVRSIAATCATDGRRTGTVAEVPTIDSLDAVPAWIASQALRPRTVLVAPTTPPELVERLAWLLEGTDTRLTVALPVRDVAARRLHHTAHGGVPATCVDLPRFRGPRFVAKGLVDRLAAAGALLLLSPVLGLVAVGVKVSSPGPLLYRQTRIGLNGREFQMLKFRSMVPDAHARLAEVLRAEGVDGITPFYKPRNDPRVTPVGRVLRKYSLDELPQLVNVIRGDMSLVGPRPQIDSEVACYDARTARRLLVKPGCTGLWQTSGRSHLSPDEGARLDVWYAENCTPLVDLRILLRTLRVIAVGDGAV